MNTNVEIEQSQVAIRQEGIGTAAPAVPATTSRLPLGTRLTSGGTSVIAGAARWALPGLLICFVLGFSIARPEQFATWTNAKTILFSQSITAIVAFAALMPLLAGEVDISVGGVMGTGAVFAAWGFGQGWGTGPVVLATLAFGLFVGSINGILVVRAGVNSFIATLAVTTVLAGVAQLITGGQTLYRGIPHSFNEVVANQVFGVPLLVIYGLVLTIFFAYLTSRTSFGRLLRASGSGREAAKLIGVNTTRYVSISFLLSGVVAALAGLLQTANLMSADPADGQQFLLSAIAAVFLGAIVSARGHLNAWGTLIAVLLLGVGVSGLTMIGAPVWVPEVFDGVALVLALLVSRAGGRGIAGGFTGGS